MICREGLVRDRHGEARRPRTRKAALERALLVPAAASNRCNCPLGRRRRTRHEPDIVLSEVQTYGVVGEAEPAVEVRVHVLCDSAGREDVVCHRTWVEHEQRASIPRAAERESNISGGGRKRRSK